MICTDTSASRQRAKTTDNRVLYEQVTDVNIFLIRVFAFAVVVAVVVALHRVCIRTLMS
jgi:hypothetical protein